jgi:CRISPR-associated protein Cas6
MYWTQNSDDTTHAVPDAVVDLAFNITCRCLPIDHAYALSQALLQAMPWLGKEERAGIHLIHVAESSHGWQRPEDPENELLHLSQRTKLVLRLPKEHVADAREIIGTVLQIGGHRMEVGEAHVRLLSTLTTLFSRYVVANEDEDEEQFMQRAAEQLKGMDIGVRKLLCGRSRVFQLPSERILTRRLMATDLTSKESIRLQQEGLGPGRKLGFGLFIPHKGITPAPTSP